jgi:sec-independent protein translocase protein TatA
VISARQRGAAMVFPIAFLDGLDPTTVVFVGIIAVLLFGERLPEVARSFGKKFTEFRKNVQSIQDEIRTAAFSATSEFKSALDADPSDASSPSSSSNGSKRRRPRESEEDYEEATAPKFVPPPSEPAPATADTSRPSS